MALRVRPAELKRLANVLDGAEHFRRMRLNPSAIELAATMPMSPSHLERELASILGRPGGYLTTSEAFSSLARATVSRLVIMSPFVDPIGFRWIRSVFEAVQQDCLKVLILRNTDQYAVDLGVLQAQWLSALQVKVFDYHLSLDVSAGRALPIETFHAKLVVADDALAYVSSANLLSSSQGVSLETGLLVEGLAASQASRLVDAVLHVARAL